MKRYAGIADAHGVESFIPKENNPPVGILLMRANANRQRHAVVYQVDLEDTDARQIEELREAGKYIDALQHLKLVGRNIGVSAQGNPGESWSMIPDHKLDPYWKPD